MIVITEEEGVTFVNERRDMTYANRVNSAPTGPARVPRPVVALGALGAVPFLSFAVAVPFLEVDILSSARYFLCGYGAVILSFLGGIH